MELFLELALTISLPFIFTFFLIKLTTMHPITIDTDQDFNAKPNSVQLDRYQWVPKQAEVIELKQCHSESKSLLRLSDVKESNGEGFDGAAVVAGEEVVEKSADDQIENTTCRLLQELIENEGARKGCTEIEIESAEEEEEEGEANECEFEGESGDMSDWVEIDFVEMPK